MSKVVWKPGTFINPVPAVMVSCGTMEKSNIVTVAWTGTINSDPAMCYISLRPSRYSYNIIKNSGEFVINLTTSKLAKVTDWCGCRTGEKYDKFKEMKLTKEKANFVKCPMIKESPVSIECKVKEIKELGGLIQVNAGSVCGKFGPYKRKATALIKAGLVDFVASDVHFKRTNYMLKAYNVAVKKFGRETADKLFAENAKTVLNK